MQPYEMDGPARPRWVHISSRKKSDQGYVRIWIGAKVVPDGTYERKHRAEQGRKQPKVRIPLPRDILARAMRAIQSQFVVLPVGSSNPLVDHMVKRAGIRKGSPGVLEVGGRAAWASIGEAVDDMRRRGNVIEVSADGQFLLVEDKHLTYEDWELIDLAEPLIIAYILGSPIKCAWPGCTELA